MPDLRPTRRAFLAAAAVSAAAAVAGCAKAGSPGAAGATGADLTSAAAGPTSAPATATAAAGSTAASGPATWAIKPAAAERVLAASYAAVIKAHPTLKPTLLPLQAAHTAHAKALRAPGTAKAAALPPTQAGALIALARAEQHASSLASTACVSCPVEGAVLLGSIAAADASHLLVLQSLGAK
jgi:hypothetical protein